MRKLNILFLLLIAGMPLSMMAQKMGNYADNWYIDYTGSRSSVTAPSSIAGPLTFTMANDGDTAGGDWGKAFKDLGAPILNADVVKADPYDACATTLNNPSAINGKVALILRGGCEFGEKAKRAQDAGAIAVIIVNQLDGPPVGMGAGAQGANVTIPVIMISKDEGAKIEAQLGTGVKVSFATWGNGYTKDIGIVDRGISLGHAYTIPIQILKGSTDNPYKNLDGAVIGNFGSTNASNVKLKRTLSWTPTGGSTSVVSTDSIEGLTIGVSDSIITPFIDRPYDLNATTTGRYDVKYEVTAGNFVDDYPGDNTSTYSIHITDRWFSKGRFDLNKNLAMSGLSTTLNNSTTGTQGNFTWGPSYYFDKANYVLERVQVGLTKNIPTGGSNSMQGTPDLYIWIWEWKDVNADGFMQIKEVDIVASGKKTFGAADTSGQIHTLDIKDAYNENIAYASKAKTWYWVTAAVPEATFLMCDGVTNYFPRTWAKANATTSSLETYAPMYGNSYQNIAAPNKTDTTLLQHFPFGRFYVNTDSTRFSQQKDGFVPAIPLQVSLWFNNVENTTTSSLDIKLYPNPATDVVTASVNVGNTVSKVHYKVLNAMGAEIMNATHNNVTGTDKYSVSTSQLAAGSYYMIIDANDKIKVEKFSIIK